MQVTLEQRVAHLESLVKKLMNDHEDVAADQYYMALVGGYDLPSQEDIEYEEVDYVEE